MDFYLISRTVLKALLCVWVYVQVGQEAVLKAPLMRPGDLIKVAVGLAKLVSFFFVPIFFFSSKCGIYLPFNYFV